MCLVLVDGGSDDECDDDEQKNKLIFIFYRYVSSNERVSYSLTPEYILLFFHSILRSFFFSSFLFNGFKHIFQCESCIALVVCVCVCMVLYGYLALALSLSHLWQHFLPSHFKICCTFISKAIRLNSILLLLMFQQFFLWLFCFISFFSVFNSFFLLLTRLLELIRITDLDVCVCVYVCAFVFYGLSVCPYIYTIYLYLQSSMVYIWYGKLP